jgi:hypothetical protein
MASFRRKQIAEDDVNTLLFADSESKSECKEGKWLKKT